MLLPVDNARQLKSPRSFTYDDVRQDFATTEFAISAVVTNPVHPLPVNHLRIHILEYKNQVKFHVTSFRNSKAEKLLHDNIQMDSSN
ncbi:hypothetical protein JTB14_002100 [Gonioctena quinquepunctata]|nr:hypothetical protein JTB14_002100 [Gonioctena quinquepunctata]